MSKKIKKRVVIREVTDELHGSNMDKVIAWAQGNMSDPNYVLEIEESYSNDRFDIVLVSYRIETDEEFEQRTRKLARDEERLRAAHAIQKMDEELFAKVKAVMGDKLR